MYSIIAAIIMITTVLFLIVSDISSRVITVSFGVGSVIIVVICVIANRLSTRKIKLMFGPIKEQMDDLKSKTKLEYTGTFSFIDVFINSSLFKYTPLKSQQPPISEYMIFHKNDLVTVLTVYKPDLKNIIEVYHNVDSFNLVGYMVLYKKAIWLAVGK